MLSVVVGLNAISFRLAANYTKRAKVSYPVPLFLRILCFFAATYSETEQYCQS